MQNQLELERVSGRLYKYLCDEVVGTENIVRYRRLYYRLHDDICTNIKLEFISSGSKAEGLDLPGSDFDLMILLKSWEVYEDKSNDKGAVLMFDTDNALPGFALLTIAHSTSFFGSKTTTADGNLISNIDFLMAFLSKIHKAGIYYETNGPSISNSFLVDFDLLGCLKCQTWPKVAKPWLLRFRPSGWPSQDIISKIVAHGCLLVPVGSKSACSEGNPFEWRFSFSLSEKLLVHSFNHTQLLCYALLKIWLKEILNSDNILNKALCSYYMKTVLFWILEENDNLNWIPQNLLQCFLSCIDRLHYWIVCGYFPNYFIPEHNMIDGKLSHEDLANLSLILDKMNMRENWMNIMFSVPSLRNFCNPSISIQKQSHHLSKFDKAVLSIQTISSLMLGMWGKSMKADIVSTCIMYRMVHTNLPNSVRKCFILMFLKENKKILVSLNIVNRINKRRYLRYKECLSRLLINNFYNAESGWLHLAAFFYSTQNYHEMSCILKLSSSILYVKQRFVNDDVNVQSFKDISKLKKLVYSKSFLKRMRYEISRVYHFEFNDYKTENHPFLSKEIPKIGIVGGLKYQCSFYFLKFLCGRKQGNSLETKSAFQLLKTSFEEEISSSTNMFCLCQSFSLLSKALELSNDIVGYLTYSFVFLNAVKRLDEFEKLVQFEQHKKVKKMILKN